MHSLLSSLYLSMKRQLTTYLYYLDLITVHSFVLSSPVFLMFLIQFVFMFLIKFLQMFMQKCWCSRISWLFSDLSLLHLQIFTNIYAHWIFSHASLIKFMSDLTVISSLLYTIMSTSKQCLLGQIFPHFSILLTWTSKHVKFI